MVSSSQTEPVGLSIPSSNRIAGTFFFDADGATVRDVARAISDFWAVSVLIAGPPGDAKVNGRIVTADLKTALEALGLFAGVAARESTAGSGVYYFGGQAEKVLAALPAWGFTAGELGNLGSGGTIVGDKVILEAPAARIAQVREALETLRDRPSLTIEVFVVDTATNTVDRVNAWLDQVRIGAGYAAQSALPGVAGSKLLAGPVWDVNVRGLLDLLETDTSARVELRQQAQILSGSKTLLESGQVEERQLITREPETGKDLVSKIERRTIGLNMTLAASAYPGGWQVRVDMNDSDVTGGKERTTTFRGDRRCRDDEPGFFLLGSFTRDGRSSEGKAVAVLGSAPGWLGRQFRKRENVHATRSVMILARIVRVDRIVR